MYIYIYIYVYTYTYTYIGMHAVIAVSTGLETHARAALAREPGEALPTIIAGVCDII